MCLFVEAVVVRNCRFIMNGIGATCSSGVLRENSPTFHRPNDVRVNTDILRICGTNQIARSRPNTSVCWIGTLLTFCPRAS